MEDFTVKEDELQEEISDKFLCCVCLELVYKPIVLSCGHLSCFWCVHKSMNGLRESHCPICRDPYVHFPSVCQKLHFLLKKIYPLAHKNRQEHVLKDEQEQECFSPQIDVLVQPNDKVEEEVTDNALPKSISIDDLLCSACDKLLVRPVVLNCGHVYCEGCVVDMAEENEKIKCKECNVCDPRGFPKVCLVIEQLLEENFPEEYSSRKSGIHKTPNVQSYHKEGTSLSANNNENDDLPWWANPGSNVHIGAGCDSCGVYPIIGERYRCRDCKEEIGYDLCKDCYDNPLKVPGRFNQQHTPEHRLELARVPQLHFNLNSIGLLIGPMVNNAAEEGDENEEAPPPTTSNESSPSTQ